MDSNFANKRIRQLLSELKASCIIATGWGDLKHNGSQVASKSPKTKLDSNWKLNTRIWFSLIALQLVLPLTGCVQRRLQIRSQPEGALVSIDRQPVGLTPVSVPYTYAGTREFQLEKDGFKTVRVAQNIRPAWFDRFPISFFSNHFAGREVRDDRLFDFQMEPKEAVNEAVLFERANDFRDNIQRGTLTAPIRN